MNRYLTPDRQTRYILRRHRDGTIELIFCLTDKPIRVFGDCEDSAFKRAMQYINAVR